MPADDVASILIARTKSWIDAMSLQKLLYYVQAWHLAVTDEPLFDEQIKAWTDGPVVPAVWHSRRDKSSRRALGQDVGTIEIDDETSDLIELVLRSYGSMSAEELSALTHVEYPWLEARGDLPPDAHSSDPISIETMAQFYRAHRKLGGRSAADLAAGGIHVRAQSESGPVDIEKLLELIDEPDGSPTSNRWGSSNLSPSDVYDSTGIETEFRRWSDSTKS